MGSQGITGWVATHGEPLLVPDVSAEPRYYCISEEIKTRSELAVPIKLQDEMIGVLTAESTELNAFSESDTFTLQPIADQLAPAIGNARLYEAAQQEIYRRQEVEAEIRQLNEALEQRVRERTAQLEAINKELSVFAYSVSHDLRAPLRSIDGFSQALLEDYGERLDAQGQDYLRRVRLASQRMGQLIDDLLNLSRLTRSEMHYEEVDLSALAREVATRLQESQLAREVAWVIADGLSARGDAHLLSIMLENLLSNAWKFTGKQPTHVLKWACWISKARLPILYGITGPVSIWRTRINFFRLSSGCIKPMSSRVPAWDWRRCSGLCIDMGAVSGLKGKWEKARRFTLRSDKREYGSEDNFVG
jgi:signal transduction histidine kinase